MAASLTGAQAMVAQLESYGVEYVFGTCGHTNIALLDAIGPSSIEFVIARHEQTAAHAADGWARVTGQPGVAVVTAGPGLTDAVTGVASAQRANIPMLIFGGQGPRRGEQVVEREVAPGDDARQLERGGGAAVQRVGSRHALTRVATDS